MKIKIFFLLFSLTTTSVYAEMGTVNGDHVNLRKGPGTNYGAEWKFSKGYPVKIIKKQGDWVNIEDFEGEKGWLYSPLLSKTPQVIVKINKARKNKVDIRKTPSTTAEIIGQAYHGVVFRKKRESNGWVKVEHEGGLHGWIKKEYLWGY